MFKTCLECIWPVWTCWYNQSPDCRTKPAGATSVRKVGKKLKVCSLDYLSVTLLMFVWDLSGSESLGAKPGERSGTLTVSSKESC